jgi:hypothetical protein
MMESVDRDVFARSVRRAVESHSGAELDSALVDLGWHDALASHRPEAISILFELQGSQLSSSAALGQVLAACLDLELPATTGLVLPPLGQSGPPGHLTEGQLVIRGLGASSAVDGETAWLIAHSGGAEFLLSVPVADLDLRPVRGMDPDLGLLEISGTVVGPNQPGPATPRWRSAVATAQLAVGYELVGAARRMLELARLHALDRVQFGQPISRFQAVRHRLAETLVDIESAQAVLDAGWEEDAPTTAAIAKALAGRGALAAARHCQQVLAGIGFTSEHGFHRYARRVFVLEALLGGTGALTRQFGTDLLDARRLPPFAPL